MTPQPENEFTNRLGSAMVILGWLLAIGLLGFLYHKMIYTAKEPQVVTDQEKTKLVIKQDRDLHFRLRGKLNQKGVDFLVDTGATYTAISESLATALKLSRGVSATMRTANGEAIGYITTGKRLQLGPIELKNIRIVVMPGMGGQDALLGMDALKHFDIEKANQTLILTYPKSP